MNKLFAFVLSGLLIAGCAAPACAGTDVDAAAVTVKADGLKDGLKEGLKDGAKKDAARPARRKKMKDGLKNGPKKNNVVRRMTPDDGIS